MRGNRFVKFTEETVSLTIDLPSVFDPHNVYKPLPVIDLVDDAVLSDTNSPVVLGSDDFMASGRARIMDKTSDPGNNSLE
jgi:hypothetical protein